MISQETLQEHQQGDDMEHGILISHCIGRIASSGHGGEVMVEFNGTEPCAAKLLAGMDRSKLIKPESAGRDVLLVFEQGDPARPIIIGLMEDPLEHLVTMEVSPRLSPPPLTGGGKGEGEAFTESHPPKEALIDGKRITIEAREEIILKCGDGSITIRKDGKIIIKGTHLLSRSSGPIRVKGARVDIN